jgi:hypothetical protein
MTRLQASQRVYGTSSRIGGVRYANPYLLRRSKRVVGKQQFRMTCARRFTASADSRSCSGNPQQSSSRWQATTFSRTLSVPRRDPAAIEIGTRDGRSNELWFSFVITAWASMRALPSDCLACLSACIPQKNSTEPASAWPMRKESSHATAARCGQQAQSIAAQRSSLVCRKPIEHSCSRDKARLLG